MAEVRKIVFRQRWRAERKQTFLKRSQLQCNQKQVPGGEEMFNTELGAKCSITEALSSSSRTNNC